MKEIEELGKRLKETRQFYSIKISEVSKESDVKYSTISAIERGITDVSLFKLQCIADALNVSLDYLLGIDTVYPYSFNPKDSLGGRLRSIFRSIEPTIKTISESSNVGYNSLLSWLADTNEPTATRFASLAKTLCFSVDDILCRDKTKIIDLSHSKKSLAGVPARPCKGCHKIILKDFDNYVYAVNITKKEKKTDYFHTDCYNNLIKEK